MAKKSNVLKVDFSGVSERAGFRIPAGDYIVKVKNVEQKVGETSGKPYLNWEFEVISGGDKSTKGKTVYFTTSLQPQALFNLRSVLIALGQDVPKKLVQIDLGKLKGKVLGVTVEDDEYRDESGKKVKKSSVVEVFPVKQGKAGKWEKLAMPGEEEFDEDEDEDEDEDDDDDDDDEDEDDDDDDEDEDDDDEDEDDDEDDEDEDEDEDDDDDDEDDDDDDEDEAPKKKSSKKSPPASAKKSVKKDTKKKTPPASKKGKDTKKKKK